MKHFFAVFALIVCVANVVQAEESSHMRLLLHSTNVSEGSDVGVAGWVIAPNLASTPNTWLVVVGPKFSGRNWWMEVLGGAIVSDRTRTELIDVRAKLPNVAGCTPWLNLQVVDFSEGLNSVFYTYFELERPVVEGMINLGLETENTTGSRVTDDLSAGVHLNIALGSMNIISVYQWHLDGPDQFWLRVPINF